MYKQVTMFCTFLACLIQSILKIHWNTILKNGMFSHMSWIKKFRCWLMKKRIQDLSVAEWELEGRSPTSSLPVGIATLSWQVMFGKGTELPVFKCSLASTYKAVGCYYLCSRQEIKVRFSKLIAKEKHLQPHWGFERSVLVLRSA